MTARFGADLEYSGERTNATLSWTRYAKQSDVADLETTTDGYDMIDASVSYRLPMGSKDVTLFLKAENLGDTEALVHTSFIKDIAPRPGRNFTVGIRGEF